MPIMLDRACDITDFANSDDDTRHNLTHVCLDNARREVLATDGHVAARVPLPTLDAPAPLSPDPLPGARVLLAAGPLKEAWKRAPKGKVPAPGVAGMGVGVADGAPVLSTWDKTLSRVESRLKGSDAVFPDMDQVWPSDAPRATVIVDPSYLLLLAEYAAQHAREDGRGSPRVYLEVRGPLDPIVAEVTIGQKRRARLLAMPLNPSFSGDEKRVAPQTLDAEILDTSRREAERLKAEVSKLEAVREANEAQIEKLIRSGREASAEAEKFAAELLALKEASTVGPIDADAIQELRAERDTLADALDTMRYSLKLDKAATAEATVEAIQDEIRTLKDRLDSVESVLEDHDLDPKKKGGFDLAVSSLADQMRDYANAIDAVNDIRREEKKHEIDREGLAEVIGDLVQEPDVDALDVAVAASEVLDVIDNGHPTPWPLLPLREALRKYAAARDDVRMPSLKFD